MSVASGTLSAGRVDLDIAGHIANITINNPERHNAMSLKMWEELGDHVEQIAADDDVRVVAVRGAGSRSFMSGADISEFSQNRGSFDQAKIYQKMVDRAEQSLMLLEKPTLALIQGICMGGGIGVALSCDLRYCSSRSRFRMPAARLSLGYELSGIERAVQIIGVANTADIFFNARSFDGREAMRIGLVNECILEDDFEMFVQARLKQLAGNAPLTLRAVKRALNYIADPNDDHRDRAREAIAACFTSADYHEGQRAFMEKRNPVFTGY